ncbi:DUF6328 family protein [Mycolicibacterium palauense]|uniref:DUF6328 family protein n=1 Tax=Mycolicibacterium palauense TaxID=2034511 RepID=UPI000BFEF772|nr:DUF6328 family protein [Mycolicibacterium palauense]
MTREHSERDERGHLGDRSETESEQLDRNWSSLLQELRVAQTGVQVFTAFLLTVPFQQRFEILDESMRRVYLATLVCSVISSVLLLAPVGMHRLLFRRHRLNTLVSVAHVLAYSGLLLLGLALTGATVMVFDVVAGSIPAVVAGAAALLILTGFWVALPLSMRRFPRRDLRREETNQV